MTELRSCLKDEVGGGPGLLVLNGPYGLCGRKATLKKNTFVFRAQELCERGCGGSHN